VTDAPAQLRAEWHRLRAEANALSDELEAMAESDPRRLELGRRRAVAVGRALKAQASWATAQAAALEDAKDARGG
jgi:hypothetical protein